MKRISTHLVNSQDEHEALTKTLQKQFTVFFFFGEDYNISNRKRARIEDVLIYAFDLVNLILEHLCELYLLLWHTLFQFLQQFAGR